MTDAPKKHRVTPLRWNDLTHITVDAPREDVTVGDVVVITGDNYAVEGVVEHKQYVLEVRKL